MQRDNIVTTNVSENEHGTSEDGDIQINNLVYEMPKSLSVRTSRTNVNQYPQQSTYTVSRDTVIVFNLNTGNSFVDAQGSYLKFRMKASGVDVTKNPPTFGVGSALNLINNTRIRTRSGVEVSRTENANVYNHYRLNYTKTTNWISTVGSSFYMNTTVSPFNQANTLFTDICIPLTEIDSFFRNTKNGQLIPAQLCSGLNIEISLEGLTKAFKDPALWFLPNSSLILDNVVLSLSSVNMSDETSKLLNLEAAETGLEYVYPRVYSFQSIYPSGSGVVNLQIQKAVSQAIFINVCLSDNANSTNGLVDSFVSENYKYKSYQFRLGSSYYPNQPVTDPLSSTINGSQGYLLSLSAYDKLRLPFSESSITSAKYATNYSSISTCLERDSSLQISGLPINNSRLLEILIDRDTTGDVNKLECNAFLEYISVARAYIDNVSVAI